jgi:hypothetical protein
MPGSNLNTTSQPTHPRRDVWRLEESFEVGQRFAFSEHGSLGAAPFAVPRFPVLADDLNHLAHSCEPEGNSGPHVIERLELAIAVHREVVGLHRVSRRRLAAPGLPFVHAGPHSWHSLVLAV